MLVYWFLSKFQEDLSDDDDKSSSSSEEPKYLFDICTVSSSGGQEFRKLEYGEKPIQLKCKWISYTSLFFNHKTKVW